VSHWCLALQITLFALQEGTQVTLGILLSQTHCSFASPGSSLRPEYWHHRLFILGKW
jgi:hypothetical protein